MAAQQPDKILFKGEKLDLYSNPLELFWTRRGKASPAFIATPECTRGYVAAWEIRDEKLLLKDIDAYYTRNFIFFRKPAKYTLKKLFPKSDGRPVVASWFSGKLRVPIGKMILFEPSGFDSRFEKEFIITIDKGEVIKVVTIDFKEKSLVINSETTPE